MGERINRQADERIYQPKIHSNLIREIYKISEATGLPMTVILDQAIREYLGKYETNANQNGQVENQNP
jgi:hypothetical protein